MAESDPTAASGAVAAPPVQPGPASTDPDMIRFLDMLEVRRPLGAGADVAAVRERSNRLRARLSPPLDPQIATQGFLIPTAWGALPCKMFRRRDAQRGPAMLYLHGGGWTVGSVETHRGLMEAYAAQSNLAVIGLDYALAPEVAFPGALMQCLTALQWVIRNSVRLEIDHSDIAIAGDSAGANLAVAICLAATELAIPGPRAAVLSYGTYDSDLTRHSYRQWGSNEFLLTKAKMAWFWDQYVPRCTDRKHPFATPLNADLSGLPPLHITVAGRDILYDENLLFSKAAKAAGVSVDLAIYPDAVHGFMEAISFADMSRRALEHQLTWL